MPETEVVQQQVTETDIDKMSAKQLEEFVKAGSTQAAEEAGVKPQEPSKETPPQTTGNKVVEGEKPPENWIEIDAGSRKLKYRNDEEVRKALAESQKFIRQQKDTIDRYNAERGQLGNEAKEVGNLRKQNEELTRYIDQLTKGAQSMSQGQPPNVVTQGALQSLMRPGQDSLHLLMQELGTLKNAQLEQAAELERLRGVEQSLSKRERQLMVDTGIKDLYSEVGDFTKNHPEFALSRPFSELDDIVSEYGDAAKSMMSEQDWNAYSGVMNVVGMYKNEPSSGIFNLARKNFDDLEEAYLIHSKRSGRLGDALAQARKAGAESLELALTRGAQSAVTIPNTQAGNKPPEMGEAEIDGLLNMPIEQINANPELKAKWEQAVQALGINSKMLDVKFR